MEKGNADVKFLTTDSWIIQHHEVLSFPLEYFFLSSCFCFLIFFFLFSSSLHQLTVSQLEFVKKLGHGAFATVFSGIFMKNPVAIKVFLL